MSPNVTLFSAHATSCGRKQHETDRLDRLLQEQEEKMHELLEQEEKMRELLKFYAEIKAEAGRLERKKVLATADSPQTVQPQADSPPAQRQAAKGSGSCARRS